MHIYLIILTSNYLNFIQNRINKNINALEDVKGLISLANNIFDFYAHLSRLILYLIPFYHHVIIKILVFFSYFSWTICEAAMCCTALESRPLLVLYFSFFELSRDKHLNFQEDLNKHSCRLLTY